MPSGAVRRRECRERMTSLPLRLYAMLSIPRQHTAGATPATRLVLRSMIERRGTRAMAQTYRSTQIRAEAVQEITIARY